MVTGRVLRPLRHARPPGQPAGNGGLRRLRGAPGRANIAAAPSGQFRAAMLGDS
jgi:hypothetical protein